MTNPDHSARSGASLVSTGGRAAELFGAVCERALREEVSPRLEVARDLALDLERQLKAIHQNTEDDGPVGLLVEAAVRCGDLAVLAACNVPALPPGRKYRLRALSAVRQASEVAISLVSLIEAAITGPDKLPADNALRDARSAAWKASLAARQVEESQSRAKGP